MTDGYAIGETDFECWGRLWKACPSDPEVDSEEREAGKGTAGKGTGQIRVRKPDHVPGGSPKHTV